MRSDVKAGLILAMTFVLGAAAGALGAGMIGQRRAREGPPPNGGGRGGGPRGFVENMESVIEPRDPAQRTALRPYLDATDRQNRAIVASARGSMPVACVSP